MITRVADWGPSVVEEVVYHRCARGGEEAVIYEEYYAVTRGSD